MNDNTKPARRQFMELAALGTGVALLGAALPGREAQAATNVEALLLSCMDFRLMDNIEQYMSGRDLRDNYDHIILAGASLGAVTEKYPAWNRTFWEHLDVAIKLHNIKTLLIMDHRDCGAYKVILGEDFGKTPEKETRTHAQYMKKLQTAISKKYPSLKVELLLMALDGKVEKV